MVISLLSFAIILLIDSPFIDPESAKGKTIDILLLVLSLIFLIENSMKIIAYGFLFNGSDSYLRHSFINLLDVITAISSFIFALNLSSKVNYLAKLISIFRIIIILSFLSKHIKQI